MDSDDVICGIGSLGFGIVLMGAYWLGHVIRLRMPKPHLSREMTEMLLAVIAMLVTFSAISLGLMLNSSLNKLQYMDGLVSELANRIVRLDDTLVEYGPGAELARVAVANYARREAAGLSEQSSFHLTRASLRQVGAEISRFAPTDPYHSALQHDALDRYNGVVDVRFRVITEGNSSSNMPFKVTLGLWLSLTYFVFGLNSDRNLFVIVALAVSMSAIVAAVFVIVDMDTALGGLISVSRAPLSQALGQL